MLKAQKAVFVVVVLGAALALAGCSDSTHGDELTLKLIEPGGETGSFGVIGKATQKGVSPGNGFAFSTPLQDPSSKKTVGQLDAFCIATKPSTGDVIKGECSGTVQAPSGELALNVGGLAGNNVSGSIVGGTGKYAGATGTFNSVNAGKKSSDRQIDTYNIILP